MNLLRRIITLACIVATFIATVGEEPTAKADGATNQPTATQLQRLQGYWEGDGREGNGPKFKSSITITGNSLHCYRDSNYWFETTFTLPAGTGPQRLDATIKASSYSSHIGQVVVAIFKIEGGMLTLAASDHGATPKNFDGESNSLFVLRKVQLQKTNAEASTSK